MGKSEIKSNIICTHSSESKRKRRKKIKKKREQVVVGNVSHAYAHLRDGDCENDRWHVAEKNMNYLTNSVQEHFRHWK